MKRLKEDVLKLSKADQYEIYEAIRVNLFEENEQPSTKRKIAFLNGRMSMVNAGKGKYMSPEQLRRELDDMIG
jgi:hypothetical protein